MTDTIITKLKQKWQSFFLEESDDENVVTIPNLPGSQVETVVEIAGNLSDSDDDDDFRSVS